MSRFHAAAARLAARLRERVGEPVAYRRGGRERTVTAWAGRQGEEAAPLGTAARVDHQVRDFLLAAADLAGVWLPGERLEPARGDEVVAGGVTYKVGPTADGDCWRWADPQRLTLRVHARPVEARGGA